MANPGQALWESKNITGRTIRVYVVLPLISPMTGLIRERGRAKSRSTSATRVPRCGDSSAVAAAGDTWATLCRGHSARTDASSAVGTLGLSHPYMFRMSQEGCCDSVPAMPNHWADNLSGESMQTHRDSTETSSCPGRRGCATHRAAVRTVPAKASIRSRESTRYAVGGEY